MNDSGGPDTTELLADLTRTLRELERELGSDRPLRPPTPAELTRFTSEVAIPALVLVLQTNVRLLQLLQRTLRLAQSDTDVGADAGSDVRDRAERLGRTTLAQLDNALDDLQSALEGRPPDDEARELFERARRLQNELSADLADGSGTGTAGTDDLDTDGIDPVEIDVEEELQTIKDDLENDDGDDSSGNGNDPSDGRGDGGGDAGGGGSDASADDRAGGDRDGG